MAMDDFSKPPPFLARTKRMKAPAIKCKAKRHPFNAACHDVTHYKVAFDVGFSGFRFCLLNRYLGGINSHHMEVLLRKPYGVIASSASNFQCIAGFYGRCGYGLNQVEVRFANIPRRVASRGMPS